MPGGKYDSSKTRVQPVFDALWTSGRDWLPQLLALASGGCADAEIKSGDLTLIEGRWESKRTESPREKCLNPPVSLLSWMIRNAGQLSPEALNSADASTEVKEYRQRLATGDPETIEHALRLLRGEGASRAWYIFEGPTCPDVYLVARDALVVIEGKRTEPGPTVNTTWLTGRHQIWRHIDAAWELRSRRAVYGLFIIESDSTDGSVPEVWRKAAQECLHPSALLTSFPHRSMEEVIAISRCYLGVTTWRNVCERFKIDWRTLPREVPSLGS